MALDPFKLGGDEDVVGVYFWWCRHGCWRGDDHENTCVKRGNRCYRTYLYKWTHRPLGQLQIMIDSCIVVFRFSYVPRLKVPMYSWLSIFLMGKRLI